MVALAATFVALASVKDRNITLRMNQAQAKSIDTWNYYQAKSMKQNLAEATLDQMKAVGGAEATLERYKKAVERYDHEKEDKSVATYGKKPKLSDGEKKGEQVEGKPKAAAIMSGGTTLTGTPRDTIEIDPMMKLKPGLIGQTKNNNR